MFVHPGKIFNLVCTYDMTEELFGYWDIIGYWDEYADKKEWFNSEGFKDEVKICGVK